MVDLLRFSDSYRPTESHLKNTTWRNNAVLLQLLYGLLGGLVKNRFLGPTPRECDLPDLRWGLGIHF